MNPGSAVHVDMRCLQDPTHPERGIPTYARELALAVDQVDPDGDVRWVLDERGPVPAGVTDLLIGGRVRRHLDLEIRGGGAVRHVMSPFLEHAMHVDDAAGQYGARIVTLYDLIPLLYRSKYLGSRGTAARYGARLELVRHSDLVLSISDATSRDAIRMLGVDPKRVVTVGTGVSARFRPTPDRDARMTWLRHQIPRIRDGFIMYTGGIDFRKNISGLLAAYSLLPLEMRKVHQLAIVCQISDVERDFYRKLTLKLGITRDVLFTGFVTDDEMVALYQTTSLFVFPSIYEGFGLPVAEAMASGAVTIAGNNSSLIEVVTDARARFNAEDPAAIAKAMTIGLEDQQFRAEATERARAADFSWASVASKVLEAYEDGRRIGQRHESRQKPRKRLRVAYIGVMPPAGSGIADYSAQLVASLAKQADVHVFSQRRAVAPTGVHVYQYKSFTAVDILHGGFDEIFIAVGNSAHHVATLNLLREIGRGTLLLHDVNLQDVHTLASGNDPAWLDESELSAVVARIEGRLPPRLAHYRAHKPSDYYRLNDTLSARAILLADRTYVHSKAAQGIASLQLPPDARGRVTLLPFGHSTARLGASIDQRDAVVSMGIASASKKSTEVLESFVNIATRRADLVFALVGEVMSDDREIRRILRKAKRLGVADRVHITGRVDREEYWNWLARAPGGTAEVSLEGRELGCGCRLFRFRGTRPGVKHRVDGRTGPSVSRSAGCICRAARDRAAHRNGAHRRIGPGCTATLCS